MARRYRKSRAVSQRQYRARLAKYERYKETTLDPKSFKEWNAPYRQSQFMRKEYKIYLRQFKKRKESSTFGFRLTDEGNEVQAYDYRDFREQYLLYRNTLQEEVKMGERARIGSIISEMINDQAYELSRKKAQVLADYLIREERQILIDKKLISLKTLKTGETVEVIKRKRLELLVRQGEFVRSELGFWNDIKEYYQTLVEGGASSAEAKKQIGMTYFKSPE